MCIKYKIMAVQPLNKTKIIKKKTNKIRRFQSDEFKRVKVSRLASRPAGPFSAAQLRARGGARVGVASGGGDLLWRVCGLEILEETERC